MDQLAGEYTTDELVQVAYHVFGSDPFKTAENETRFYWYGFTGTPSCAIDGLERIIGGGGSTYGAYKSAIDNRLTVPAKAALSGSYTIYGSKATGSLDLHIECVESMGTSNVAHFVVVEDSLRYLGKWYRFVARDILPQETVTISSPGQTQDVHRDFTVDPTWDLSRLSVLAIVQGTAGFPKTVKNAIGLPEAPATAVDDAVIAGDLLEATRAFPNPFNPKITISYSLREASPVTVSIFDVQGRRVATLTQGEMPAGANEAVWDGTDSSGRELGTGVYFYQITAGTRTERAKIVMLK